jgi:hypothetical protein
MLYTTTRENAKFTMDDSRSDNRSYLCLQVGDHGIVLLLTLMHDAEESRVRHSYALKVAMFAC